MVLAFFFVNVGPDLAKCILGCSEKPFNDYLNMNQMALYFLSLLAKIRMIMMGLA